MGILGHAGVLFLFKRWRRSSGSRAPLMRFGKREDAKERVKAMEGIGIFGFFAFEMVNGEGGAGMITGRVWVSSYLNPNPNPTCFKNPTHTHT